MRSGTKLRIKLVKPKTRFPIDVEDDPWYLEGYEEGLKMGKERESLFVTNLLQQTDCTDERIAFLVDVPLSFVIEVKKSLEKPKS